MKPALYYTIVRDYGKHRILAVTSETQYGRVNGRYAEDDQPTHTRKTNCTGQFKSVEVARDKLAKIAEIRAKYTALTNELRRKINLYWETERQEIDAFLKGDAE